MTAAGARFGGIGSDFHIWRIGNVEPSAQFSDGDPSDRLFRGGHGAGAGDKSRGRQEPSQIFAGTCTACHKSPRGLLKTVPAGSLQGFLKQHYTTSPEMASLLAAFLVSNGASDPRYVGTQAKPGKDEKSEAKPSGLVEQLDRFGRRLRQGPAQEAAKPEAEPKEAAKPEAAKPETSKPEAAGIEPGHHGRNARRLARPGETPAAEGQTPEQAASERGPDGRRLSAKQKLSKRGKPGGEEPPKSNPRNPNPARPSPRRPKPARKSLQRARRQRKRRPKAKVPKPRRARPSGQERDGQDRARQHRARQGRNRQGRERQAGRHQA